MAKRPPRKSPKQKSASSSGSLLYGIRPAPNIPKSYSSTHTSKDWAESGQWVGVLSSNVEAIKYDPEDEILFVAFKGGAVYQYLSVPERTARDMYNASSIGRFVHRRLKGQFPYARVK